MSAKCLRCGSEKLIPPVALQDHYGSCGGLSQTLEVDVAGKPDALIFRDAAKGEIYVQVCGDCGHADLRVSNHAALWEKHEQSLRT